MNALDFITRGVLFESGKILGDDADKETLELLRAEVERRKAFIREKTHHRRGCRHCGEPWPDGPACPLCARAAVKVAEEDRKAWTLGPRQPVRPMARQAAPKSATCAQGHVLTDGRCVICETTERSLEAIRRAREELGACRIPFDARCECGSDVWLSGLCMGCGKPDPEARKVKTEIAEKERRAPIFESVYQCKPCGKSVLHRGKAGDHPLNLYCADCGGKTWVCRHCGNRIDADPCVWCLDGNGGALRGI